MGAVLPPLYGAGVAEQILTDFEQAAIPPLHKAMFRWVKRFTQNSWQMGSEDIDELRRQGVSDADICMWAQIAALQGWWTMSADGGGIPLEGSAITGPVLQKPRAFYEAAAEGLTAGMPNDGASRVRHDGSLERDVCWITRDEASPAFREIATWADARYGVVPSWLRAVSLRPEFYRRHRLALELLEEPQSESLTRRCHALVRSLTATLNRSHMSKPTVEALVTRVCGEAEGRAALAALTVGDGFADFPPAERVALDFAAKLARNAYKVSEKDALSFHEVGLDDEAYIDVLNTVAIQTSIDRLGNALGVAADATPALPRA